MHAIKHPVRNTKRIMPNLKSCLLVFVQWFAILRYHLRRLLALLHLKDSTLPIMKVCGHSGLTQKLSGGGPLSHKCKQDAPPAVR